MDILKIKDKKTFLILSIILAFGFLLRIYHINFQSLWADELDTINISDPDISWRATFDLINHISHHPPLHFIIEKIFLTLFGQTSLVLRGLSVIGGTISIWAMFLLGKEILNKNLGLIAAAITSVNYYTIIYSQEGRDYIFAFLFTVLSFLYLVRLIKSLSLKDSLYYAFFTLLLLYTHYYGVMILSSQIVLIIISFF